MARSFSRNGHLSWPWIWLALTIAALALRVPDLGNPVIDLDEQMYLLVGSRMWQGALPYVDIWDRKPVGLFLVYAATQAFGGDGVVAYQLAALLAALLTAGTIAGLAAMLASRRAGLVAGLAYLVWIALLGGRGGQSPVFYDLPVALAALLVWRTIRSGRAGPARIAMLLIGLAIQIKPTVVVEGAALAALALHATWRRADVRNGARAPVLLREGAAFGALALAPTLLVVLAYGAIGHGGDWWFANVRSIFLRHVTAHEPVAVRLQGLALVLCVPAVLAILGIARSAGQVRLFLGVWLGAALVALLAVAPYYNHYALPLLVPLTIAAGIGAARSLAPAAVLAAAAAALLHLSGYPHLGETRAARQAIAQGAALVRHYAGARGCPFVFQAPPVFYTASSACLPTRFPFASHLTFAGERGAIGVDSEAEVARILRARPPVIVTTGARGDVNRATFARVDRALAEHYRRVGRALGYDIYARADRSRPDAIPAS